MKDFRGKFMASLLMAFFAAFGVIVLLMGIEVVKLIGRIAT